MSSIGWASGKDGSAVVFCSYCRTEFSGAVSVLDAQEIVFRVSPSHHCTPSKPYRPPQITHGGAA